MSEIKEKSVRKEEHKDSNSLNERSFSNHKKFFKQKKKHCILCQKGVLSVDYKDVELLKHYIDSEHTGKILSHFITGACPRHQREVSNAIHRARIVALLPFIII